MERRAEVPVDSTSDEPYFWIEPAVATRLEAEAVSNSSPHIDLVATLLATVIDSEFFEKPIVEDQVFFSATGRETFGLPRFSGQASLTVKRGLANLDIDRLEELLAAADSIPSRHHHWLKGVKHRFLNGTRETDPWKRFLWNYLALEILTHKLAGEFYESLGRELSLRLGPDLYLEGNNLPISELLWAKERLPVTAKFTILALKLFPESATDDVESFKTCKEARDALSHGSLTDTERLPTNRVRSLLERYIAAAVRFKIMGSS